MTHEEMEILIDELNVGKNHSLIFLSTLTEMVELAKVWDEEPRNVIQQFFGVLNDRNRPRS